MKKLFFILILLLVAAVQLSAQNRTIDSLLTLLKNDKVTGGADDTIQMFRLIQLSSEYTRTGSYDSSLAYSNKVLALYSNLNKYPKGILITLKRGNTSIYTNIGNAYSRKGDYPKALDHYLKALKMAEELKEKVRIGNIYGNMAAVYMSQGEFSKCLDYNLKSLKIRQDLSDKAGIGMSYCNIGVLYIDMSEKGKVTNKDSLCEIALDYYLKALELAKEVGDKDQVAGLQGNIGNAYYIQANAHTNPEQKEALYNKAFDYYLKAMKMSEELGAKASNAVWHGNIGSLYADRKKYADGEKYLLKAIELSAEIGLINEERIFEELLTDLYTKTNRYQLALEHHKKSTALKDTLFNEKKEKDITRREMNYEFEKKEAAAKAEQEKREAVQQAEAKRQQIIIWFTVAVAIVVALFALFIFRALRITQNQKKIITEKNQHITASINYAKRIQDAILPSKEDFKNCFSDHFLFLKPKDIVSGDFYWMSSQNGNTVVAVADCTGHGVPGAFMSMIGNTLLNEIVNEKHITQPADILNRLNEGIVHALRQESSSQDDGMDIAVCMFEKDKGKITFAGANQSLYIVADNSIHKTEGDFFAIGSMFGKKDFLFSQQEVLLKAGASVFLSSDGFADQRGGEEGKKFSSKLLSRLFIELAPMDGEQQYNHIQNTFNAWKGNHSQIDDVLVMGIKI